jgi:O-methyltransferase
MAVAAPGTSPDRSLLNRAARNVLVKANEVLPEPIYALFSKGLFSSYRTGVEFRYKTKLHLLRRREQWQDVRRAEAVVKTMPFSLVGPSGLEATYQAVHDTICNGIIGDIVECGVAQGGSSAIMALAMRDAGDNRHMWLFDSYEGMPESTDDDIDPESGRTGAHVQPLPKGSCLGTFDEVDRLMGEIIGLPRSQFTMVKGWFEESVQVTAGRMGPIAVLRLDGDWYESTRCCLEGLYPLLASGGLLIIDDYHSCFGAHRAVHEFLANQGDPNPKFENDGSGGILYLKP